MRVIYGPGFAIKPVATQRERVDRLDQAAMLQPQIDCPVRHHFAPGVYLREMSIPADTYVSGVEHMTENLIVVSKGRLRVVTADGTREVVAGEVLTCLPGTRNAVVTLEDSRWVNVFSNPTNETDPDKLVELLTTATAGDLLGGTNNQQLQQQKLKELS